MKKLPVKQEAGVHGNSSRCEGELDFVALGFDWELPPAADESVTFWVNVERCRHSSSIRFQIKLNRLEKTELEKLYSFLIRRQNGLDDAYTVTRAVVELLDISLWQQQPGLTKEQRNTQVRELLLSNNK